MMANENIYGAFRVLACDLFFLPATMRVPLKFGSETIASIINARVCLHLKDDRGKIVRGWGETPLSVAWAWPSNATFKSREKRMLNFCDDLAEAWRKVEGAGHAMEIGWDFLENILPDLLVKSNAGKDLQMPYLAALICNSAFDLPCMTPVENCWKSRFMKPITRTI